jgi:hypothetical protein
MLGTWKGVPCVERLCQGYDLGKVEYEEHLLYDLGKVEDEGNLLLVYSNT